MKADHFPEISSSTPDVLQHKCCDVTTSAAEQSDNISGSVVPVMRDSPIPGHQITSNYKCSFVRGFSDEFVEITKELPRGFSRESDELV
jgi:hypothetical protein